MKRRRLMFFVSLMSFVLWLTGVPTVLAQDDTEGENVKKSDYMLEEIVVTGSRIAREKGFGQTSPVTVMGKDDITSIGFTRIEDILGTMPQIEAAQNSFISNGATGTAQLDLRGLGAKRTLVLMNNHRFQPGGTNTQTVDVNQIPASMVERVEVLTGGASATYGADAVAGVVNFIMRKVQGVEIGLGASAYRHYNDNNYMQGLMDDAGFDYPYGDSGFDGKTYDLDITMGSDFAGGKGNASAYFTWRQNDPLKEGERDYSSCALNGAGDSCGGSSTAAVPNFDIFPIVDGEIDWANEFWASMQPDSSLTEFDGSNTYNYAPINYYMRPDERWSMGAFLDLEINSHATAYMELNYYNGHTAAQIAESGTFYGVEYDGALSANSLIPAAFRQSIYDYFGDSYTGDDFAVLIAKRNVEGGPRSEIIDSSSFRIVGGMRGAINDNWDYDVSYLKGQTSSSSTYINDFYGPKVTTAVDSAACDADSECIPYEVFTYNGVTPEAASVLSGKAISASTTSIQTIDAIVNGDLGFGLPAGNINVAVGYEWRKEFYQDLRDFVYEEGLLLGQGGKTPSLEGGFIVNDVFGEANVPLVSDVPLIEQLTMNLALRYSDHDVTGGATTYRVGMDMKSTDFLRFRANYNRAVRSPNIEELYYQNTVGLWNGIDPCAGADPQYSAAECARTGIPESRYGTISGNPAEQYYAQYGGNAGLEPETADTWTLGIVVEPMDKLKMSLDYWNISIEDTIDTIGAELTVNMCAADGALCDLIHRAPGSYSLWLTEDGYVEDTYQNIGKQDYEGLDFAGSYWLDALGGMFNVNIIGTYLLNKETTPIADDPSTTYDCTGIISSSCFPSPKWRHTANVTYDSRGFWSVTARWRFFSSVDYNDTVDKLVNLDATSYYDLNALFRIGANHDIMIGVNNILDDEPPLMGSGLSGPWGNANTISGFYDVLGRYFYAKATLRF
jgi:iron complex outermembrane receptor protein